jgi:hypothetical protein
MLGDGDFGGSAGETVIGGSGDFESAGVGDTFCNEIK